MCETQIQNLTCFFLQEEEAATEFKSSVRMLFLTVKLSGCSKHSYNRIASVIWASLPFHPVGSFTGNVKNEVPSEKATPWIMRLMIRYVDHTVNKQGEAT